MVTITVLDCDGKFKIKQDRIGDGSGMHRRTVLGGLSTAALWSTRARAQTEEPVRVGLVIPLTGPFQTNGRQIEAGIKTFIDAHGDRFAGRQVQIITRDDAGVADNALRLSQELVTRERVHILMGYGNTPSAVGAAQISARGKVPQVILVAATSSIMDRSPYMVRVAQTIPQIASTIGIWTARQGVRNVVTLVSDYGPGLDAEEWFSRMLEGAGGQISAKLRAPLVSPDFAPFLQRAADAKPEAVFVFVPTGVGSIFIRQFVERGLDRSGVRIIAMSDVTDDDLLNNMGDAALGVISGGPYATHHQSEENRTFVARFRRLNPGIRPNVVGVSAWDGMTLLKRALEATNGKSGGDALLAAMKGQSWESPRGPVTVDASSRDIVQNIYMRKVERVDGELHNVEFETIPAVRDPAR